MKHFREIKSDPFSTENFLSWLRNQSPSLKYEYTNCSDCLIAKYLTAMGFKHVRVYPYGEFHYWENCSFRIGRYPIMWDRVVHKYKTIDGAICGIEQEMKKYFNYDDYMGCLLVDKSI